MIKKCSILGFIGSEKYDLITYLSRVLYNLNQRVLILDFSEIQALILGLPQAEGTSIPFIGGEILEQQGVDYYINNVFESENSIEYLESQILSVLEKLEELKREYHFILIDFGYLKRNDLLSHCTQIFYVTDLQKHNIIQLKECLLSDVSNAALLIMDILPCKIKAEHVLRDLNLITPIVKSFLLNMDILDFKYKLLYPYSSGVTFRKLSMEFKNVLLEIIGMILPELKFSTIKRAYWRAKRGK